MLFFTIYVIAAIIIYWLVARKLRKKAESEYIENGEIDLKNPFFDHKNGIRQGIKGTLAFVLISTGFVVFFMDGLIYDYWIFFGDKRTAFIEERYGIIVDDDIKLKKYTKIFGGPDGSISRLELESKIDGLSFAEKNISGELKSYAQDGIYYPADTEDIVPHKYEMGNADGIYWYKSSGRRCMTFYKDGDKYTVVIH